MTVVAVADCGTNSTRLLVTDGRVDLVRRERVTSLGRGATATNVITPEGIERTASTLREYAQVAQKHAAEEFCVVATEVVRAASNCDAVLEQLSDAAGVPVRLLSGIEEAEYSFRGAVTGRELGGNACVIDIGGGSTEFAVGSATVMGSHSLPIGSVRLTETYLESDPPDALELSSMVQIIRAHLDDLHRAVTNVGGCRLIGVAGTVMTTAAVELGIELSPALDGTVLTKDAVEDVFRTLATESLADRVHNPGLQPERADVIVAGVAILAVTMRYFGFDSCLVSVRDLLDGIASELAR